MLTLDPWQRVFLILHPWIRQVSPSSSVTSSRDRHKLPWVSLWKGSVFELRMFSPSPHSFSNLLFLFQSAKGVCEVGVEVLHENMAKETKSVPHRGPLTECIHSIPYFSELSPTHYVISSQGPSCTLRPSSWVLSLFLWNIPIPCFPLCQLLYLDHPSRLCVVNSYYSFKTASYLWRQLLCLLWRQLCSFSPDSLLRRSYLLMYFQCLTPVVGLGHNRISLNVVEWMSLILNKICVWISLFTFPPSSWGMEIRLIHCFSPSTNSVADRYKVLRKLFQKNMWSNDLINSGKKQNMSLELSVYVYLDSVVNWFLFFKGNLWYINQEPFSWPKKSSTVRPQDTSLIWLPNTLSWLVPLFCFYFIAGISTYLILYYVMLYIGLFPFCPTKLSAL